MRAALGRVLRLRAAAVRLGDHAHDREPEAGSLAARPGATEALEGPLDEAVAEALALVLDVELDIAVDGRGSEADATAAVPERVVDEVAQRLFQADAVAAKAEARRRLARELSRRPAGPKLEESVLHHEIRTPLNQIIGYAELLQEMSCITDESFYRMHAAAQLIGEGRRAEADEQLRRALGFFRSVGATWYLGEGEALLAASA